MDAPQSMFKEVWPLHQLQLILVNGCLMSKQAAMEVNFYQFKLAVVAIILISCQQDNFDVTKPDVNQFVSLVKNGSSSSKVGVMLPDFTLDQIEGLIFYLNDTTRVEFFPANPISSKFTSPKILNECLLWTIEGIRQQNKYPSLEPCLIDTLAYSAIHGYTRLSGKQLLEVSVIYKSWYAEYLNNPSESLRTKNLIEGTRLKWN